MATPPHAAGFVVAAIVALALLALPPLMNAVGAGYYVKHGRQDRRLRHRRDQPQPRCFGYGGMGNSVRARCAFFFGLGAYATGVLISEGVLDNGGVHLLATVRRRDGARRARHRRDPLRCARAASTSS